MKELREQVNKILNDHIDFAEWATDSSETVDAIMRIIRKHIKAKSFEFMEPCEPDCDEARHNLHQGSWEHMTRMDKWADSLVE